LGHFEKDDLACVIEYLKEKKKVQKYEPSSIHLEAQIQSNDSPFLGFVFGGGVWGP
jgi:hypothetical protein